MAGLSSVFTMIKKLTYEELEKRVRALEKVENERMRTEKASLEGERKYRSMMEIILDAAYICSANFKIEYMNPAMIRQIGRDASGESCFKALHGLEEKCSWCMHQRTLQGEHYEQIIVSPRNNHVYQGAHSPLVNADGSISKLAIFRDITDLKHSEEKVKESENKFRSFAEQSLVGVNLIQDGIFKYVNPKFAEIFGYTVEECLDDMPFRKLVYPEDLPIVEGQVKKRLESEVKSVHYTFRGLKKGGEIIYIEIFGSVTWIDGKPAAIGTILDITSRKAIEDALKANEEKLKAILETIPDPIVMYNAQGYPKFLNPAFSRVFGWSLDELRGKRIPFVPEDQKEITATKMKELFDFGKPVKVDSKRLTKEGLLLDVRISAALTKNSEGKYTGMVVSLSDITERKNLEKDRTKLILELEKLSTTDPLTGAKNRRYFNEAARKLFNLSIRHKRSLSALMLDIDNFKKVNDTYGHDFGDDVLKKVAQTCQKLVRKTDLSARYGGEEFCFFFPETNANEAFNLAEKLRAAIANLEMKANDRKLSITASFGISECIHDEDSLESLIKRSDEALYEAKRNGRNCAVICSL
jgi:diguanylate cyclase (GGDEF)-like protein/PAS domain S-box-containing protein